MNRDLRWPHWCMLAALLLLPACTRRAREAPVVGQGMFSSDPAAWGLRSGGVALFAAGSAGYILQSRCEPGPCVGPGRFGDWEGHAGQPPAGIGSKPTIASWGDGRIDIFVRGLRDNALWHQTWESSRWLGWENLGGGMVFGPAAVSWGPRRIDVFIVGLDGYSVWQLACAGLTAVPCRGGNWSPWAPYGGYLPVKAAGDLALASTGDGRLDIFALGGDSAIWHQNWDGSRWVGWESLGGTFVTAPAVAPRGGVVDVFATDRKKSVWLLNYGSRGSSDWRKTGIALDGSLASAASDGKVSLFAIRQSGSAIAQASCVPSGTSCELVDDTR